MIAGLSGSSDTLAVTWVVLAAALLHALWNALLHEQKDRLVSLVLLGIGAAAASICVIPFVAFPSGASLPFLFSSAAIHVAYSVLLVESYRLGDFGQVYPIARGTSPWVVAIVASFVVGDTLTSAQVAGVAVVSVGLVTLVFAGGVPGRAQLPAVGLALATGLTIAAYTIVDGVGVRRSGSPFGYAGWLLLVQSIPIPLYALVRYRGSFTKRIDRSSSVCVLAGVISFGAYALVLWAQTRGALAAVAALREVSVVFGAVIGWLVFRERFGPWRVVASVLVVAGVVLLSLS